MNESHQLDESTFDMKQQKLADQLPSDNSAMQFKPYSGNNTGSFGQHQDKFVPLNMQPLKESNVGGDGSDEEEKAEFIANDDNNLIFSK